MKDCFSIRAAVPCPGADQVKFHPPFGVSRFREVRFVPGLRRNNQTATTKPFSQVGEDTLKRTSALMVHNQTTGCDNVGPYSQRDLPPVPQGSPSRHHQAGSKAMTEIVAAACIFFSIGIFLAHAFDVYRMR